jgi:hypothetical protein
MAVFIYIKKIMGRQGRTKIENNKTIKYSKNTFLVPHLQ